MIAEMSSRPVRSLALVALLCLAAGAASAQEAKKHVPLEKSIGVPAAQSRPVPSLAVLNAAGAKLEGGKLVLTGIATNTIVFADRPVRAAGHEMTKQFIMQWDEGKDNFAKDPPNATVSVLGANPGEVADAVVVLKSPKLDGTTLTFDVAVLEGALTGASGPVAVFIDAFAVRGPYGGGVAHVGGFGGAYYHAPVYHGAWYGHPAEPVYGVGAGLAAGAMVGAAAAAARPYYAPPPCGYYPYPPCY
ncbi:hypothetical protein NK718_05345 [Alsobacter sp. SYSU M60028]|uniref:DUF5666 domain-containing protein n=1 Tax=Alsobacter ponti TaxID=2962936 RepID=A0ABT1L8W4_9HYPH|nr:hypothetical protein [Alsobacter ponti]MCP8937932.1 hypothetical protein [Alsobacter ponti]